MSICSTGLGENEVLLVPPAKAWDLLGVSNSTGYELLGAGELDSIKIGRARRITIASIHRLIERRLAASQPEAA
jgi:excisionase family DNA binding protein